MHHDLGANAVFFALGHSIAICSGGLPAPGGVAALLFGVDGDGIGHHESRIETYAELADNIHIARFVHFLAEAVRTGGCDNTKVIFQIFLIHADAVIGNGQGAVFLVRGNGDLEITAVETDGVIRQGHVGKLIHSVAGVGNDLAQEDLFVGVNRIDHQVQETLGLCFKLFFCHDKRASFDSCVSTLLAGVLT